jgi:hypothetical protein
MQAVALGGSDAIESMNDWLSVGGCLRLSRHAVRLSLITTTSPRAYPPTAAPYLFFIAQRPQGTAKGITEAGFDMDETVILKQPRSTAAIENQPSEQSRPSSPQRSATGTAPYYPERDKQNEQSLQPSAGGRAPQDESRQPDPATNPSTTAVNDTPADGEFQSIVGSSLTELKSKKNKTVVRKKAMRSNLANNVDGDARKKRSISGQQRHTSEEPPISREIVGSQDTKMPHKASREPPPKWSQHEGERLDSQTDRQNLRLANHPSGSAFLRASRPPYTTLHRARDFSPSIGGGYTKTGYGSHMKRSSARHQDIVLAKPIGSKSNGDPFEGFDRLDTYRDWASGVSGVTLHSTDNEDLDSPYGFRYPWGFDEHVSPSSTSMEAQEWSSPIVLRKDDRIEGLPEEEWGDFGDWQSAYLRGPQMTHDIISNAKEAKNAEDKEYAVIKDTVKRRASQVWKDRVEHHAMVAHTSTARHDKDPASEEVIRFCDLGEAQSPNPDESLLGNEADAQNGLIAGDIQDIQEETIVQNYVRKNCFATSETSREPSGSVVDLSSHHYHMV